MLSQDAEDLLDALYSDATHSGKRPSLWNAQARHLPEWSRDRLMDAAQELEANGDFIDLQSAVGFLTLTSQAQKRARGRAASADQGHTVHNTMHIGSVINSPIQQGGSHNAQTTKFRFSRDRLEQLVAEYKQDVESLSLSSVERKRADAQIQTIEAQLIQDEPNEIIIKEAGRSLRTILEGAAGGAIGTVLSGAAFWTTLLSLFG